MEQKMKRFFATDGTTQTEDTQIVEVKEVTRAIEQVLHVMATKLSAHTVAACIMEDFQLQLQEVGQVRKELKFAQHVLQADYENKLNHRATEL